MLFLTIIFQYYPNKCQQHEIILILYLDNVIIIIGKLGKLSLREPLCVKKKKKYEEAKLKKKYNYRDIKH